MPPDKGVGTNLSAGQSGKSHLQLKDYKIRRMADALHPQALGDQKIVKMMTIILSLSLLLRTIADSHHDLLEVGYGCLRLRSILFVITSFSFLSLWPTSLIISVTI